MKPEKFTPIAPTEEQKAYEKLAKKEASSLNSGFENLIDSITGKGFNKEDITRNDACRENELRDEIGKFPYGIKNKEEYSKEKEEYLKKVQNSTLRSSFKETKYGSLDTLNGIIKGYNVEVKKAWHEYARRGDSLTIAEHLQHPFILYSGTIDGLNLSEEEAEKIYEKYFDVAHFRTKDIAFQKNELEHQKFISTIEKEKESKTKAQMDAEIKAKADEEARIRKTIALKDLGL